MPKGVYARTEEHLVNMSVATTKQWADPEHRKRQLAAIKCGMDRRREDPEKCKEWSANLSRAGVKRYTDPGEHEQQSVRMKAAINQPGVKVRYRVAGIQRWDSPEYKTKQLKAIFAGRKLLPNRPERFLIGLLQELFPNQWRFVGDGSCWITSNGKHLNPDFIHVSQKKIIEHFGDFHHGEGRTGISNKQHEQERIDLFAQLGYQTLVIWQHELVDIDSITDKIQRFNNRDIVAGDLKQRLSVGYRTYERRQESYTASTMFVNEELSKKVS